MRYLEVEEGKGLAFSRSQVIATGPWKLLMLETRNQYLWEVEMSLNKLPDLDRAPLHSWHALLGTVFVTALLAAMTISAQAQSFTGSISGTVTDPMGAVVPNVTITLTASDTGQTRTTTTNSTGEYLFSSLSPGTYKVRIMASGFSANEIDAQLAVAQQLRADAQLKVGVESDTVNISAGEGGLTVGTQNAELANVVNQRQVRELPLITRNPYDLITLSPGVTDGPDRGSGNQRG